MALAKAILKQEIKAVLQELKSEENQSAGIEKFAKKLATAIDNYVKSATVSTVVTGTCPAGAVTGTGTGTLS